MSPPQKLAMRPLLAAVLLFTATLVLAAEARRSPQILVAAFIMLVAFLLYEAHVTAQHRRDLEVQVRERTAGLSEANARLKELCLTDTLTGLPNRRYLFQAVELDVAVTLRAHRTAASEGVPPRGPDLVFYVLDLDDFKSVNDDFGRVAGDSVLQQVAEVLVQTSRASDLVVRWGGEEFLVLSRHVDRAGARAFAERIRQAVRSHIFTAGNGRTLHRTCSVGFAVFPFLPEDPEGVVWETVLGLADQACYAAKRSGRDAWVGILATGKTAASGVEGTRAGVAAGIAQATLEVETSLSSAEDVSWDADGREARVRALDRG